MPGLDDLGSRTGGGGLHELTDSGGSAAVEIGIKQRVCPISRCRPGTETNLIVGDCSNSQFIRMRLEPSAQANWPKTYPQ